MHRRLGACACKLDRVQSSSSLTNCWQWCYCALSTEQELIQNQGEQVLPLACVQAPLIWSCLLIFSAYLLMSRPAVFLPPKVDSSLPRSNISPIILWLSELLLYTNFTFSFIFCSRKCFIICKVNPDKGYSNFSLDRNTTFTKRHL